MHSTLDFICYLANKINNRCQWGFVYAFGTSLYLIKSYLFVNKYKL